MAKDVKLTKAVDVPTTMRNDGMPMALVSYAAGYEGKVPEAHYEVLRKQGAIEGVSADDPPASDKPTPGEAKAQATTLTTPAKAADGAADAASPKA